MAVAGLVALVAVGPSVAAAALEFQIKDFKGVQVGIGSSIAHSDLTFHNVKDNSTAVVAAARVPLERRVPVIVLVGGLALLRPLLDQVYIALAVGHLPGFQAAQAATVLILAAAALGKTYSVKTA